MLESVLPKWGYWLADCSYVYVMVGFGSQAQENELLARPEAVVGHTIQAFLFENRLKETALAALPSARLATLHDFILILPVTDSVFDEAQTGFASVPDSQHQEFWKLSDALVQIAEELSRVTRVAYIETEYHGG